MAIGGYKPKHTKGLDEVLKKLNTLIEALPAVTIQGLLRAAIMVRAAMEKTPPNNRS